MSAHVVARSFDRPDETWSFPGGGRMDVLAGFHGMRLGRGTAPPGWHWAEHVKPLAGTEWCEIPHAGIVLSGREMIRMADGTEFELKAGDAFLVPAGHDAWVVGDEPCVSIDFLPET